MNEHELFIIEHWGEQGKLVIEACKDASPEPMTCKEFLSHCTACGGNWGGMLLSGIAELYPAVYEAIPDNMGHQAFACIASTMELLGIIMNEE